MNHRFFATAFAIASIVTCTVAANAGNNVPWQRSTRIAIQAADDGDWDTAIINFNRVIAGNPNECLDAYYQELVELAEEAKENIKAGVSERSAYQLYHTSAAEIYEDCEE